MNPKPKIVVILGATATGKSGLAVELARKYKGLNPKPSKNGRVGRTSQGEVLGEVKVDIKEVRSPESNATIVAQMIADGLEKRLPFRRVTKQMVEKVMANRDVKGVRVILSGILGGNSMARTEMIKKGRIPLQTFRADIDYAQYTARLPLGAVGVKVWIYKGEIFSSKK